jgi:hypothetical protein
MMALDAGGVVRRPRGRPPPPHTHTPDAPRAPAYTQPRTAISVHAHNRTLFVCPSPVRHSPYPCPCLCPGRARAAGPKRLQPFACDDCEYRTAYPSALIVHRRRHTGDRPYGCPACTFTGLSRSSVVTHMQVRQQCAGWCRVAVLRAGSCVCCSCAFEGGGVCLGAERRKGAHELAPDAVVGTSVAPWAWPLARAGLGATAADAGVEAVAWMWGSGEHACWGRFTWRSCRSPAPTATTAPAPSTA